MSSREHRIEPNNNFNINEKDRTESTVGMKLSVESGKTNGRNVNNCISSWLPWIYRLRVDILSQIKFDNALKAITLALSISMYVLFVNVFVVHVHLHIRIFLHAIRLL